MPWMQAPVRRMKGRRSYLGGPTRFRCVGCTRRLTSVLRVVGFSWYACLCMCMCMCACVYRHLALPWCRCLIQATRTATAATATAQSKTLTTSWKPNVAWHRLAHRCHPNSRRYRTRPQHPRRRVLPLSPAWSGTQTPLSRPTTTHHHNPHHRRLSRKRRNDGGENAAGRSPRQL